MAEGVETEVEHPLALTLEGRDGVDSVLGEALGDGEGLDIRDEATLVVPLQESLDRVVVAVGLDNVDLEGGMVGIHEEG